MKMNFKILFWFTSLLTAASTLSTPVKQTLNPQSNCAGTLDESEWNKYSCALMEQEEKYQRQCVPRRFLPLNATSILDLASRASSLNNQEGKVKGLVVFYHGYTACPDAFDPISATLQEMGYAVYVPLLPGQGLNLGYGCSVNGVCAKDTSNPSEIPTSKNGYQDWTIMVNRMINEQLAVLPMSARDADFKVHALGLSVGAALAVHATQQSDSPIDNIMVVNPLWSSTAPILDFNVKRCNQQHDPKSCIMQALGKVFPSSSLKTNPSVNETLETTASESSKSSSGPFWKLWHSVGTIHNDVKSWLVKETLGRALSENYDTTLVTLWQKMAEIGDNSLLMRLPILKSEYGWGKRCLEQNQNGRGGICTFRLKHLIALQSFTSLVVGNLLRVKKGVRYSDIRSDLDGGARDSVSLAITKALGGSRCEFKLTCTPEHIAETAGTNNNLCAAPHSVFSRVEGLMTEPHTMFWEPSLFSSIFDAMENKAADFRVGVPGNSSSSSTEVDPAICVSTNTSMAWGFKFETLGIRYITESMRRYAH